MINDKIPETIPANIVIANAGLLVISSQMELPAGIDGYHKFVNDAPIKNNTGIAPMNPSDHLPSVVFGIPIRLFCYIFRFNVAENHLQNYNLFQNNRASSRAIELCPNGLLIIIRHPIGTQVKGAMINRGNIPLGLFP